MLNREPAHQREQKSTLTILGIDPGSHVTGFGVIRTVADTRGHRAANSGARGLSVGHGARVGHDVNGASAAGRARAGFASSGAIGVHGLSNAQLGQRRLVHINHGIIQPPRAMPFPQRVAVIAEELDELIEKTRPDVVVIELAFLGKNVDSAFKLGHVRGIVMAAAIRAGAEVAQYAARAVKKGVTGSGAASKEQVQMILFAALGVKPRASAALNGSRALRGAQAGALAAMPIDASDALALAYYHAQQISTLAKAERAERMNGYAR